MAIKNDDKFTKKPTGWYVGCGCGSKKGDLVTPPVGSVEGLVRVRLDWTSELTGQKYEFEHGLIAIDLNPLDVPVLKELGYISDAPTSQGFKGYLSRRV